MQQVLLSLNPWSGCNFIAVYIDDFLIFSTTLEAHLDVLPKKCTGTEEIFRVNLTLQEIYAPVCQGDSIPKLIRILVLYGQKTAR